MQNKVKVTTLEAEFLNEDCSSFLAAEPGHYFQTRVLGWMA